MSPSQLMHRFTDGNEPVVMGYLITGRFNSHFPDGYDRPPPFTSVTKDGRTFKTDDFPPTNITEATEDCAVVVFADVDFITDILAYQTATFGKIAFGDNSALLLNVIDDLCGSSELAAIRSRGNFTRPFTIVDEIEKQAESATAEEEVKINEEITHFRDKLYSVRSSEKDGEAEIIGSTILQNKKDLELKIHQARRRLRQVKMKRREQIEQLGNKLRNFNMMTAPAVILMIAIILGIRRAIRKRHYISHASDA
jgi:ABC-2 type transport system permease protein